MKIEITKQKEVKEEIDVELPYYYVDFDSGLLDRTMIYGKIEENSHTEIIEIDFMNDQYMYKIYNNRAAGIKCKNLHHYLLYPYNYKSTKEEFEAAKGRCLEFINKT